MGERIALSLGPRQEETIAVVSIFSSGRLKINRLHLGIEGPLPRLVEFFEQHAAPRVGQP